MAIYISTKTYTAPQNLTCCYRHHNATNRGTLLHGYALGFRMVFECHHLDDNDWTMDFSGFDEVDAWLRGQFDHTLLVNENDPDLTTFRDMAAAGLCDIRVTSGIGCEKFAEMTFKWIKDWMQQRGMLTRVTIRSVECMEHDGASAIYVE